MQSKNKHFSSNRFQFYEVVTVRTNKPSLSEINGLEGVVMGMADDEQGNWYFSVHVFKDDISWHVSEHDIQSTGKMMKREDFYDGDSIKVFVDPETGEGRLEE